MEGPGLAIGASAARFISLHDTEHDHISACSPPCRLQNKPLSVHRLLHKAMPLTFECHPTTCFCMMFQSRCSFAAITNFLAARPICTLLSLLLLSGIADLSLLTIPSTSSVRLCLLSLSFLQLPTMPFGQMSDPLLCAVCSSLL